jgi:hypothetical protein
LFAELPKPKGDALIVACEDVLGHRHVRRWRHDPE